MDEYFSIMDTDNSGTISLDDIKLFIGRQYGDKAGGDEDEADLSAADVAKKASEEAEEMMKGFDSYYKKEVMKRNS